MYLQSIGLIYDPNLPLQGGCLITNSTVVHIFAGDGLNIYGPPTFGCFFDTFPYKNFELAIYIACFIAIMGIISVNKDKMKLSITELGLTTAKHQLVRWYFIKYSLNYPGWGLRKLWTFPQFVTSFFSFPNC